MNEKELTKAVKQLQEKVDNLSKQTSQQKASQKYNKSINGYLMRFRKVEDDAWKYLATKDNKNKYIKDLIYEDMKKNGIKITNKERIEYSAIDIDEN